MEVQILKKNDVNLQLIIQGIDVSLMNALRRIIITEIPTMAVEDVVIIENSSVLNDEILAHRLGLIPLKTDLDSYNLPEECTCKSEFGCNLCRATLTMVTDESENVKTIYSGDFKPEDLDVAPVSNRIPIVKLAPNQKIRLEAYARLGRGIDHAKWQPVSVCAYKYLPKIKIDESLCDACEECVKICPKRILIKVDEKIKTRNTVECTLCKDCVKICPKSSPAIDIDWHKNSFIFNIESNGVIPLERIIIEANKILNNKLDSFLDQLTKVMLEH